MSVLDVKGLRFNYKDKELFNDVDFRLFKDDHMGLVGLNGSGKTTFLNLLAHRIDPDMGVITWAPNITFSYLDQHLKVDKSVSINDYLYDVYQELFNKEEDMNNLYSSIAEAKVEDYDNILRKADNIQEYLLANDFYLIKSEIENVISGLGIHHSGDTLLSKLSGGQRAKVFLAKMLLEEKDVLLIDEPTNFLDKVHVEWLTKYLNSYKKAFIVISHNTEFLNNICNVIVLLENSKITRFKGNYEDFIKAKVLSDEQYKNEYLSQQRLIKKTEEFIEKNISRASTSKRAKSRQKMLMKIKVLDKPLTSRVIKFNFPFSSSFNNKVLETKYLEIGYTYSLLPKLNFSIDFGERVVIVGKNGIGKSTLLKTILGEIKPIGGSFSFNPLNKVLYFKQELDKVPTENAIQYIKNDYLKLDDFKVRRLLASYGITNDLALRPLNQLSGGELTKVRFAKLSLQKSNILILDEPTNHLDKDAKVALFTALESYHGTIILVSHEAVFYKELRMREIVLDVLK